MSSDATPISLETQTALTGRVKWFNNKAGFGFITVCDGEHSDKDIFVHYSSVQVQNSQYKYLVQGEYVDFFLVKPHNSEHEYHAVNVSGIKGGNLMCETRRQTYAVRAVRSTEDIAVLTKTRETRREKSREEVSRELKKPAHRPEADADAEAGFKKVSRRKTAKPREPVAEA
jgi:cold shock CspA family protein